MLSIIKKSFFGQKSAYHILFIYENCMISIFREKINKFHESFKTDHKWRFTRLSDLVYSTRFEILSIEELEMRNLLNKMKCF